MVDEIADTGKCSCFINNTDGKHHAHYKQHHLQNTILKDARNRTLYHGIIVHKLAVENLVDNPQHHEHAAGTKEWRQLGNIMKCRDKPQPTYSHEQHHQSLPHVQPGVVTSIWHCYPFSLHPFRQHPPYPPSRQEPCSKTRQEQAHGIACRRNGSGIPKHQSHRVADNGERSATISRQYYCRTVYKALLTCGYNLVHDG